MGRQARFFYGWIVVATSTLGLLFGAFPIVVCSFPVFFKSYVHEFQAGRAAISLALSLHNFISAFLAAWIGRLSDRFGARNVILPGFGALGLVLVSALAIGSNIWQLYVFYAILGAVSGLTTSIPVWSKNPICMKSKDDGGRGPDGSDRRVTPRYITKKSPRNVVMAPSKSASFYLVFSARLSFWDYTPCRR